MIDRWNFTPIIDNERLIYDYTAVNETEGRIFDLYGLKRMRKDGWVDDCLQSGNKVILPCDLHYLPYATEKMHIFHNIIIESRKDEEYYIYDDAPYYEGNISGTVIKKAYQIVNEPFEWYEKQENKCPRKCEEIKFFKDALKLESLRFAPFLTELLYCGLSIKIKLEFINGLKIPTKRFYALLRIIDELLNLYLLDELKVIRSIFLKYADDWTLVTHMAGIALVIEKGNFWSRVERRIYKLIEYEGELRKAINDLINIIPDEL